MKHNEAVEWAEARLTPQLIASTQRALDAFGGTIDAKQLTLYSLVVGLRAADQERELWEPKVKAWEPVIRAACAWHARLRAAGVGPISGPIKDFVDAVDALAPEFLPPPVESGAEPAEAERGEQGEQEN